MKKKENFLKSTQDELIDRKEKTTDTEVNIFINIY